MTEPLLDAPQTSEPIGQIETDMFCSACGYNLHALDVRRDLRLDIPIVRCPECGKFHAAGMVTGAGRAWLSRLAAFLLILWVAFLFIGVGLFGLWMFGMDVASVDAFATYRRVDGGAAGAPFILEYVEVGPEAFPSAAAYWAARLLVVAGSLAAGWNLGAFLAVFQWHVRRRWWLLAGTISILAAGFTLLLYRYGGPPISDFAWIVNAAVTQTAWQIVGLAIGLLTGRIVTRRLLCVVLTRRLLQHVTFLWHVDGRRPPAPQP